MLADLWYVVPYIEVTPAQVVGWMAILFGGFGVLTEVVIRWRAWRKR